MDKVLIDQILKENIKNYDLIASDFDKTRSVLWPEIEATASYITPKASVIDAGCGNGRLFPFITKNNGNYLGFDNSERLIKICQQKYGEKYFFIDDLLEVGPRTRSDLVENFDTIYCLAVLHHIPSSELRLQALQNIKSLLKPNGTLILSVWNLWQKKYLKYIFQESLLKIVGKSKLDWGDSYIPYKGRHHVILSEAKNPQQFQNNAGDSSPAKRRDQNDNIIVQRYLHAFTFNELTNLVTQAGFQILKKESSRWNYLIIAKSTTG